MSDDTQPALLRHPHDAMMRRATYASVSVALGLVVLKTAAWVITDSVSLLSSLVDSFVDSLASLLNLLAVRAALVPADREHRFGHGKAEPMAGLAQAAFISGSAVFLIIESVRRLLSPRDIEQAGLGIAVMLVSILATALLVAYQRSVVRRTASVAITADMLHYASDVLVNGGVILALVLASTLGWTLADPLIALLVAAWIIHAAWSILRRSLDQLMDRELPDEVRARIKAIAMANPRVQDMHDLKTRESGLTTFIQLHLEMDGALSLDRAHRAAKQVHDALLAEFPRAEIIIHQDPAGLEEHHRSQPQ